MNDRLASIQAEAYLPVDRSINRWAVFSDSALESGYRQDTLPHSRWMAILGMVLGMVCCLPYTFTDYLLFGLSEQFWQLLALRTAFVGLTLVAIGLCRSGPFERFDGVATAWIVMAATTLILVDSTRPLAFLGQVRFDIVMVVAIYVLFVTSFRRQVCLALAYTVAATGSLLLSSDAIGVAALGIISSLLFANIAGVILVWRLHWLGRRQFLSTQLEKELGLELEKLAFSDSLTGISNRRDFMVHAKAELERHRRHGRPFSLLLLDLDFFKRVNDEFGHDVGDQVLHSFAGILDAEVRSLDLPARLGGEEFAVLLPETRSSGAIEVAARIQRRTRELRFGPQDAGRCTVSIGVTEVWPSDTSVDAILTRTDEAMYRAKAEGRDRMVSVPPPVHLEAQA